MVAVGLVGTAVSTDGGEHWVLADTTGYNAVALPLAAGALYGVAGVLLSPALGAVLMSASTVIVALNAQLLGRSATIKV